MKDISKIKTGTEFSAYIEGIPVTGKVYNDSKNKCIYLCQNYKNGTRSPDKLGYKFSWTIGYSESLKDERVTKFKLGKPAKDFPKSFKIAGYLAYFTKTGIKVGCTSVNKKLLQEIFNEAKRLKLVK